MANSSAKLEPAVSQLGQIAVPWWIAGGWAIDLFLGTTSRDHSDVDVAILRRDEAEFRNHLASWDVRVGLGNDQREPMPLPPDAKMPENREVLWCRPTPRSAWAFELLLNRADGDNWAFKRDDRIRLPISKIGLASPTGVQYLRPEIVLLFKAKNCRDKDNKDFANVLGRLDERAVNWLADALQMVHPEHHWTDSLKARRR